MKLLAILLAIIAELGAALLTLITVERQHFWLAIICITTCAILCMAAWVMSEEYQREHKHNVVDQDPSEDIEITMRPREAEEIYVYLEQCKRRPRAVHELFKMLGSYIDHDER